MKDKILLIAAETDVGARLDAFVSATGELTRSAAARLIEEGAISVNGKTVAKNYKLRIGDEVEILMPEPVPAEAQPENIALDVVYEDGHIIVINKPVGMVVHPAAGNERGTLVNALLHHCGDSLSGIGGVVRPGIVHRIDKDTSGLLVVAKNDDAHNYLAERIKTHEVGRIYYALLVGNLKEDRGTVDAPIGRHPRDRKKMAVLGVSDGHSRHAVTHYEVLERYRGYCFVRCELETGRTHQIRVHMAHLGHPLMGDATYGGGKTKFELANKSLMEGQCLHAGELRLTHPKTGEEMRFTSELPREMELLIEKLRKLS